MFSDEADKGPGDLDIEERELCPDGACVGVIGPDGRCKVCGTEGEGGGRSAAAPVAAWALEAPVAHGEDGEGFDEDRRLCPDGACVGLLDAAGRCKVCGKTDPA